MLRTCRICNSPFESRFRNLCCSIGCQSIYQRERKSEYHKTYYENNAGFIKTSRSKYYETNKNLIAEKNKIYREKNKEIVAERKRLYKYGIDKLTYAKLLEVQNNVCAVCKKRCRDSRGRGLAVDHCHTTGKIRGLLCSPCNQAIGLFLDDPDLLKNAIVYLEKHIENTDS